MFPSRAIGLVLLVIGLVGFFYNLFQPVDQGLWKVLVYSGLVALGLVLCLMGNKNREL